VIADRIACSSTIGENNYCVISVLTRSHCDHSVSTCEEKC